MPHRRLLLPAVLGLALPALASPAPAVAARDVATLSDRGLASAVVLAGRYVMWVERSRGRLELRSAARDGSRRRVLRRLGSDASIEQVLLSGAPDGYALLRVEHERDTLYEGEPGRRPRRVAGCSGVPDALTPTSFSVDRGRGALVSQLRFCGPGRDGLELRSPASAAGPTRRLPGTQGAVAGDYVVFRRNTGSEPELVVHDWRRDAPVYAVRTSDVTGDGSLVDAHVDERGTLVFAAANLETTTAWTASRADPRPRRATGVGGTHLHLDLAAGVLAYQQSAGDGGQALGTFDVATRRRRTLTRRPLFPGADTDGRFVTWAAARRGRIVLRVARVPR